MVAGVVNFLVVIGVAVLCSQMTLADSARKPSRVIFQKKTSLLNKAISGTNSGLYVQLVSSSILV